MMNEEQVKALIAYRLGKADDSTNIIHWSHVMGQIRALAVVIKGEEPPVFDSVSQWYDYVGIPYTQSRNREQNTVKIDDDWMLAHGFVHLDDNRWIHPAFKNW